jgi:hypothetical protein
MNVDLYNDTYMTGGGWTSDKTIKVIDGKTITFDGLNGTKKVNNGNLNLGNTGEVNFDSSMANDLLDPLEILFGNGSTSNRVVITTNYGRNIAYAGDKGNVLVTGDYQELGTSPTNMQYQVRRVSGYGTVTNLTCSFDKGTQSIIVNAETSGDVSSNYELSVRDKFGDGNIIGKIIFKVRGLEGETIPQITFVGATVDIFTVIFNNNGGTSQANPTSMTVADSETLAALPTPPNGQAGYEFAYWSKSQAAGSPNNFTLSTPVLSNMTVYAQYTMLPIYTVTFSKDTGTTDASPTTISAIKGSGTGSLPNVLPTKTGGYIFDKWTTGSNGTGTEFTASTPVWNHTTVYAKYTPYYQVTFKYYYGSTAMTYVDTVASGGSATAPTKLRRIGWTFTDWDTAFTNVTSSITVNANYAKDNSLKLYLDASDSSASKLTMDGSFNVATWKDLSGLATPNNFTQGTATLKPKYIAASGPNGLGSIKFDGTDDLLIGGAWSNFAIKPGYTAFVVGKSNKITTNASDRSNDALFGDSTGNVSLYFRNLGTAGTSGTTGNVGAYNRDNNNDVITQSYVVGDWKVFTIGKNATQVIIGQNNTESSKSSGDTNSLNGIVRIGGGYNSNTYCMDSNISEIIIYNRAMTTTEKTEIIEYLRTKYAL